MIGLTALRWGYLIMYRLAGGWFCWQVGVAGQGRGRVGAENPVTSGDLQVFVYEAAEPVSSQRPECRTGMWGSGSGCG